MKYDLSLKVMNYLYEKTLGDQINANSNLLRFNKFLLINYNI